MEERPKNLRSMLAKAKDLSELMVDLGYAALYFDAPDMAEEIEDLESEMSELVLEMRAVCVMAVRSPKNAKGMSSVLQVISAIERVANDAVDISRIVTHKLGIPAELVADLSAAEEVSLRLQIMESTGLADRTVASLELPVAAGMRITAIRRDREWLTDITGDLVLAAGDVLILKGSLEGIDRLNELAGSSVGVPLVPPAESQIPDLSKAVDVLVEMKDLSNVAVDLAYTSLVLGDRVLAAEVRKLEARLDEMRSRLELWVLQAASTSENPAELRGLLHLGTVAEDIGDQANQMVWIVERGEVHPILGIALGDSDEVAVRYPVNSSSRAANTSLKELALNIEPGFMVLAICRGERYIHRPINSVELLPNDEIIASGPSEGREALAEILGWKLERDNETSEEVLTPILAANAGSASS